MKMPRHTQKEIKDAHERYFEIIRAKQSATPPPEMPGFLQRATNFATSAIRHVGEGAPRCTEEEVAARFAICQSNECGLFKENRCMKCGCGLTGQRGLVSKLSWAGESCPVGKWGPITREKTEVDGCSPTGTLARDANHGGADGREVADGSSPEYPRQDTDDLGVVGPG